MASILTEATRLNGKVQDRALLFLMKTTPAVRVWVGGVGDFPISADAIDDAGGIYSGLGEIAELPALNALVNGMADRIDITLSGPAMTAEMLSLIDEDADEVSGAEVHIGVVMLDRDQQPAFDPLWLWEGVADVTRLSPVGLNRSASISIGTATVDRSRANPIYYTGIDQRALHPTDAFCDRVTSYGPGSTVRWPK